MHALKDLGAKRVQFFGDSELVINQVNEIYQTKHPRMRDYRNEVWYMFGNYVTKHSVQVIPGYENTVEVSLATTARKFETPTAGKRKYKVDIMSRPSITDNTKYWQVFEDDIQIKRFLELSSEFVNTRIDDESDDSENFLNVDGNEDGIPKMYKLKRSLGGKDIVQLKSNHIPQGMIPL